MTNTTPWRVAWASFFTLGISIGMPYYSLPFFYDYFEQAYGWSRSSITLGLPLAALATIWMGPLFAHRLRPNRSIMLGAALNLAAFAWFANLSGSLLEYRAAWMLYMAGFLFTGPIPHQILVAQWFLERRGSALAIGNLGVSLIGAVTVPFLVRPLTSAFGFRAALGAMAALHLVVIPVAALFLGEKPGFERSNPLSEPPRPFSEILRARAFWVLLIGGAFSLAALGAVSQHLKLIMRDAGYGTQAQLDAAFSNTMLVLLISSAAGRVTIGWAADRFPKRWVLSAGFVVLAVSLPMLLLLRPPQPPYVFAALYGFCLAADFLIVPILAAEHFGSATLGRVMSVIVPANTIGQTWSPYGVSLVREAAGSYTMPLLVVFGFAIAGRLALALLPEKR
ncbi:MAG: MFS transporter [Bryobacteraceae bacterium]